MREKDHRKRAQIPIREVGFLNADDQFRVIAFHGAWLIYIKIVGDCFALIIVTPGGKSMTIAISDTSELWSGAEFEQYREGAVYVIASSGESVGDFSSPCLIESWFGFCSCC